MKVFKRKLNKSRMQSPDVTALPGCTGSPDDDLAVASGLTYEKSGVDISSTDAIKQDFSVYLKSQNPRVLSGLSSFASLYDIRFDDIENPVLVLKAEEPGSKQKLAAKYGYTESIGHDMINHLVNDIAVMGAKPLAALDTIICGSAGKDTIKSLVKGISDACRANECDLVGGETSVQPGVVDDGLYILTASIAGIVDKQKIIDGSKIRSGDKVIALASNGLHTNGYTLVRLLMDTMPSIQSEVIGNETFIEAIMKPHAPYYGAVRGLFGSGMIRGMAHITGGSIEGNLCRIIPHGLSAHIDLAGITTLPVFKCIKSYGNITDDEMLKTFNCGVGFILVVEAGHVDTVMEHISGFYDCYPIGGIAEGESPVVFESSLSW